MASFDRPERCVLSRAHTPRFLTLTMFPCRQTNISVQTTAIAVGDCTPTVYFTRIVKEAKLILQSRGIRVHQYLDDWLLRANTRHQCHLRTKELLHTIQELGFVINLEKSELEPTQKIDFLGYHFDLIQGKVFPTEKKLKILEKSVQDMENASQTTPRLFMLASLEKTILIFSDASNQGWGAHLENLIVSGTWISQEKILHINVLELKAVFLALKSFQNQILNKGILIATDNATVVSYLNKQGGTHSWDMCLLVWRILAY